jgi:hypothetical protein
MLGQKGGLTTGGCSAPSRRALRVGVWLQPTACLSDFMTALLRASLRLLLTCSALFRRSGVFPIYQAFQRFLDMFLKDNSGVRTENPHEANLFYIPTFAFYHTCAAGRPVGLCSADRDTGDQWAQTWGGGGGEAGGYRP